MTEQIGPIVTLAYLHGGNTSASFTQSLTALLIHDVLAGGTHIIPYGGTMADRAPTDGISEARNEVCKSFLAQTRSDYLWFIDADMGFERDTLDRLLEHADDDHPVIGALCFGQFRESVGTCYAERFKMKPTVYYWHERSDGEVGFATTWDYPRDEFVKTDGTGAACLLIHRSVLERVKETYGPVWFDRIPNPSPGREGSRFSEDLSFCLRLLFLEIPLHVHTGVKTSHDKGGIFLDEEAYDRQQSPVA